LRLGDRYIYVRACCVACKAKCKCGTQTGDCKCKCQKGWSGPACTGQCCSLPWLCVFFTSWPTSSSCLSPQCLQCYNLTPVKRDGWNAPRVCLSQARSMQNTRSITVMK